jgi:hypothetical protein
VHVSRMILVAVVAVTACGEPRAPLGAGAEGCDPVATSDNGCVQGMSCNPFAFDNIRGKHVARCEPGGAVDEGQDCGPNHRCRAGHFCNVIPNQAPGPAETPGICFRFCNVDFPVCPGSTCSQLSTSQSQWLSVDGVRYGTCGGFGHSRRTSTEPPPVQH